MKYAIQYSATKDIVEYTISVLKTLIANNGHELVSDPNDADIIAVSVCDVSQVTFLEKVRMQYPNKKIAVGGHATIYYKLFALFADYVNIGQGFEFFECQSIDEIESLPSVWVSAFPKEKLYPSTRIDWGKVPVANVTKGQTYYWGAVGCKNKCTFCMTSWTNPHQKNARARVDRVLSKYKTCTIVSNDSDDVASRMTQSIMLKDFIRVPLKKYSVYRMGLEFATEEMRRKYGKPFSDDEFAYAIRRAIDEGVRLKLFCISGLNSIEEWGRFFDRMPDVYVQGRIDVKFTNIAYEMFAPIKRERHNLDVDKLMDTTRATEFILPIKERVWPLRYMPCSGREFCVHRNILMWSSARDEYEQWRLLKNATLGQLAGYYFGSGILENDYSDTVVIDHALAGIK